MLVGGLDLSRPVIPMLKRQVLLSMFSKREGQLDCLYAGFEETSYHTGSLFCEGMHILVDSSTEVKKK